MPVVSIVTPPDRKPGNQSARIEPHHAVSIVP